MPYAHDRERSLDPADWGDFRALGHRMVDDMAAWLEGLDERPVWQPMPPEVRQRLRAPVPIRADGPERAYQAFRQDVLDYPLGNAHPRFWGWVIGSGTPVGMLGQLLAGAVNTNVGGAECAAVHVEAQVLAWLKELMGFPTDAGGLLVSGASVANLTAIAVARHDRAPRVRRTGVHSLERPLTLYASTETHSSVQRALEALGLGAEALRSTPVRKDGTADVEAMRRMILADRAAGQEPFAVVGNAGTVNTGAIDDLSALADLCAAEGLWFHVDGAFGALAALSPRLRPRLRGMDRADSLAFDLHKWLSAPYGTGCVLVRDAATHREAFALTPAYLARSHGRGLSSSEVWLSDFGLELSRPFRALPVWLSLKAYGVEEFARVIEQNVAQARELGGMVEAEDTLELLAPVSLNVVCFRWSGGNDGSALDAINREILVRLQERGVAVLSSTVLEGRFALRAALVGHRTRREDLELVVREVQAEGAAIAGNRMAAA